MLDKIVVQYLRRGNNEETETSDRKLSDLQ